MASLMASSGPDDGRKCDWCGNPQHFITQCPQLSSTLLSDSRHLKNIRCTLEQILASRGGSQNSQTPSNSHSGARTPPASNHGAPVRALSSEVTADDDTDEDATVARLDTDDECTDAHADEDSDFP